MRALLKLLAVLIGTGLAERVEAQALELEPVARLDIDAAFYDPDSRPLDDGVIVRRAIVGIQGKIGTDWSFEASYQLDADGEFRPGDGKIREANIKYDGWDAADITLGQFKVQYGLEHATSSTAISYVERALPVDAFAPSRRLGLGLTRKRDDYTVSTVLFGSSIGGGDRGFGAALRMTTTPVHSERTVVHLGASAVIEKPRGKVDFDTQPEARVAGEDLVNTGRIDDVDRIRRFGVEAVWRAGPFSLQGEWMRTAIDRNAKSPDASFHGWYVGASWILTGETRPYKNGEFKRVEPKGRNGALELTTRYSRIDLDDGIIRGGRERNMTLGLTYYWNDHLRVLLNYTDVRSERRNRTDNPDFLVMRLQLAL